MQDIKDTIFQQEINAWSFKDHLQAASIDKNR